MTEENLGNATSELVFGSIYHDPYPIKSHITGMPGALAREECASLKAGLVANGSKQISCSTLCSGTDLFLDVVEKVVSACCEYLAVPRTQPALGKTFACDNDCHVQSFLTDVKFANTIFNDIADVAFSTAKIVATQQEESIPRCQLNATGWVCVDMSYLNGKRASMLDCLSTGSGSSGATFEGYLKYLKRHKPLLSIAESVVGIMNNSSSSSGDSLSNAGCDNHGTVVSCLREAGYATSHVAVSPDDVGCPESRGRIYFLSMHESTYLQNSSSDDGRAPADLTEAAMCLAKRMARVHIPRPLHDFVLPDNHPIVQEARARARKEATILQTQREAAVKKAKTRQRKWQEAHRKAFQTLGVHYTEAEQNPVLKARSLMNPFFARLDLRQQDLLLYIETACPLPELPVEEVTVNLTFSFDYVHNMPGKSCAITPGALIWARVSDRPLLGIERLMLHGFPVRYRERMEAVPESRLNSLAGNSFNGYNVAPLIVAMLPYVNIAWE